ncbi:Ger(x)C family spore germination protein [Paenibacillus soyae]|uniref:Ger(X)C family spore germination protein n=1 Tax=Paenibacillus soyae TaxID=2969249 RepID=A0A9X2MPE1_9BACL|nr:Ger(x)C family spore germination protein [Paenibacillus soyae]MCR2804025.1 Ger(x)C family spore germination protein [Paenibacillus soyae]
MYRRCGRSLLVLAISILLVPLAGCWSSNEIEDLALSTGLAMDKGQPAPVEKELEGKGSTYAKRNRVMVTIQVAPIKSKGNQGKDQSGKQSAYMNVSGSGDSIFEIFRQFSIRLDRPVIGHHLKVVVISVDLLRKQSIEQITDFLLRDNNIRPSTLVYLSDGPARETLISKMPGEVPSFHIAGMHRNQSRTSKVLDPVTLTKLDSLTHSRKSFVLQTLVTGGGEIQLSGAGIINGSTGRFIGSLNQEDTESLNWLIGGGDAGPIKAYDRNGQPITYELLSMKSKITPRTEGEQISFKVGIETEGRLIETWDEQAHPTTNEYAEELEEQFEEKLQEKMQNLLRKLQTKYKTDVAGFGQRLAIEKPAVWRKVKDDWDRTFSRSQVTITCKVKITDFGSFTEK